MVNIALSWWQAGLVAFALFGAGAVLRRADGPRQRAIAPFAHEAGIIALLYALWQLVGSVSLIGTGDAVRRGEWIVRVERDWHLPDEVNVQHLIAGHPLIIEGANLYYATMHFTALFALLLWLFARHRDQYRHVRNTIVLLTAACLLIQFLPVAPPRLLPRQYGFVDTAVEYGQSVYAAFGGADQFSAMPSVHVGWAVLVGLAAVRVSTSRWRWLVLLHPAITIFVVVATANHYWLDGIVAVALLALSLLAQRAGRAVLERRRQRADRPLAAEEPAPV